jgi:hypothetical protein
MSESESVWIFGRHAERILGIGRGHIVKVAEAAGIRRKIVPGLWPRYHRGDCERVAREAIVGGQPLEMAEAK